MHENKIIKKSNAKIKREKKINNNINGFFT